MLLTVIFGVLAVVLVVAALGHPRAAERPMLRIGGICMGLALGVIALSILVQR